MRLCLQGSPCVVSCPDLYPSLSLSRTSANHRLAAAATTEREVLPRQMPKKKPSKAPEEGQEKPTAAEEKAPLATTNKKKDEIDEIFASKKRKKSESENTEKLAESGNEKPKKLKKKKKDKGSSEGAFGDAPSRPRKKTADGLAIYTEDELGLNKSDAGGTPLCPFDCECCF